MVIWALTSLIIMTLASVLQACFMENSGGQRLLAILIGVAAYYPLFNIVLSQL